MDGKSTLSIRDRIAKVLIEKRLLTQNDVRRAFQLQKEKGGKLSDILVGMGLVSRQDLTAVLSEELGFPPIDLSRYKISPDVLKLIPKKMVEQYRIIPVSKMGNVLTVAMADPLNVLAVDDIKSFTGFNIEPVITNEKDINDVIAEYYESPTHEAIERIVEDLKTESDLRILEGKKDTEFSQAELLRLTQEPPVVKLTNLLLAEAVKMRASDILIEPLENTLRVRYRVDGVLMEGRTPPKRLHNAIISRLKVMSDLDIAERRLPQDGRFKIKVQNKEVDFRVSILPSSLGEKAAMRILDKSQAMLDLESLGFEEKPLNDLKRMTEYPHGMILICGPTGCGKTTTLYSILKYIDTPEKNIVTVEDPVEYQLYGINQVAVRHDIGLTFASSLRSILRQDPDIIMIGEIRDFETVDIAIKSALTGHLVLSTVHTTTASGSIVRLVNMGLEPFLITSCVLLVGAQRLVRKICAECKESYELDPKKADQLKLRFNKKVRLFRGKGCRNCQNTGYKGRAGLIETLVLTPVIRNLILEKAQEHVITEAARKEGMKTLRENGLEKVLSGVTTLEEILRVTVGDQDIVTV